MSNAANNSLSSVLPPLTSKIKRRYLRKYSWLPDVLRLKGSIISRIIGPILTVTIFASLVCYAATKGYKFVLTNSIFPLLSVVVGLILVFRNSTSYDRYWEGRKSFATITSNIRNFCRQVWINVSLPPPEAAAKYPTPVSSAQLHRHKVDALRLALSYALAVKHYLRGEDGINYPDYHDVLPASFARYDELGYNTLANRQSSYDATASIESHDLSTGPSGRTSPENSALRPDATKRVRAKRSKQKLHDPISSSTPLLAGRHRTVAFEASLPLPLMIAHELSKLIFRFRRDGLLETVGPAGANGLAQLVQSMVDQMTALERIANTPIPVSYSIHLKQCVTLYLFALPLTLANDLGWATVPLVTVIAFTFMGIEGIADEIEMPFGTDERDLPIDRYCQDLKEEIFYIIERLPDGGEGLGVYDDGEGDD
ncbi:UPF0187-domain-containing protein [Macrolepiota fuliginosa MF-IS2]|uniref:UPF0187-domain-containing protein n=1 Tax=Macrolepiota fuliginosa MF-IS2 TaxID=1400762 RepID=A0A9P5XGW8_9AGAR|nr:UPF0187-domain-containing protein [Macrolepiota fuliginosa MF-IS2]